MIQKDKKVPAKAFFVWTLCVDAGLLLVVFLFSVLVAASFDAQAGLLLGGVIGIANFVTLGVLLRRLMRDGKTKWFYAIALALKFVLLVTLVYFVVRFLPISPVWFTVGLFVSVVALLASTVLVALRSLELSLER